MSKSIEYLLTRYTDIKYKQFEIKMSILTISDTNKTSIMLFMYDLWMRSHSIRQFDDEQKCIEFLTTRFSKDI